MQLQFLTPEDNATTFPRNVRANSATDTASHRRSRDSSATKLWERQVPNPQTSVCVFKANKCSVCRLMQRAQIHKYRDTGTGFSHRKITVSGIV